MQRSSCCSQVRTVVTAQRLAGGAGARGPRRARRAHLHVRTPVGASSVKRSPLALRWGPAAQRAAHVVGTFTAAAVVRRRAQERRVRQGRQGEGQGQDVGRGQEGAACRREGAHGRAARLQEPGGRGGGAHVQLGRRARVPRAAPLQRGHHQGEPRRGGTVSCARTQRHVCPPPPHRALRRRQRTAPLRGCARGWSTL